MISRPIAFSLMGITAAEMAANITLPFQAAEYLLAKKMEAQSTGISLFLMEMIISLGSLLLALLYPGLE